MNWKEITEKYPKSFDALFGNKPDDRFTVGICTFKDREPFLAFLDNGMYDESLNFHFRKLYDFFDRRGIYVELSMVFTPGVFGWTIYQGLDRVYTNEESAIRPEAEEMAFMKAFELLERQLTKEEEPLAGKL